MTGTALDPNEPVIPLPGLPQTGHLFAALYPVCVTAMGVPTSLDVRLPSTG